MANVRDFFMKCVAIDYPYFSFDYWTKSEGATELNIEITILHNAELNKTTWYANDEHCNLPSEKVQEIAEKAIKQCAKDVKFICGKK